MKTVLKIVIGIVLGLLVVGIGAVFLVGSFFNSVANEMEDSKNTEEVSVSTDEEDSDSNKEDSDDEEVDSEVNDYNEIVLDTENVKVELISVEKVEDEFWEEEYYQINFDVTNNFEDTIEIQAHEASMDGKMIEDMIIFSETVSSGKSSDAQMLIENYEGELPEFDDELEFNLVIWGHEDYDIELEEKVTIKAQ